MFAKCPLVLLNLISVVLVKVSQAQQLQQNFSGAQMLALQNISNICNLGEFNFPPEEVWNFSALTSPCNFYGIECDETGSQVVYVSLSNLNIYAPIPTEFGSLTSLQSLVLSSNYFFGTIPTELNSLELLLNLDVSYNLLHGDAMNGLASLKNLKQANLQSNRFSSISEDLWSLEAIVSINLCGNGLGGPLPDGLKLLTNLQLCYLNDNSYTGTIPEAIFNGIPNLTYVDLDSNYLSGSIPSTFGGLLTLTSLYLNSNFLSGTIPSTLGLLTNLQMLWLYDNALTGVIPSELGNMVALQQIKFDSNKLIGTIPITFGRLLNLTFLALDQNSLTGRIPFELGLLGETNQLVAFSAPSNRLDGTIPSSLGNISSLKEIWIQSNSLSGPLPPEIFSIPGLFDFEVSNNLLDGTIPANIGSATALKYLCINNNNISGTIPPSLGSIHGLITLDAHALSLHGTMPSSLGALKNAAFISFQSNYLTGPIPHHLFIKGLALLDLSYNNFSGTIPREVGDMNRLVSLSLNANNLTSRLPSELGLLTSLYQLIVADNRLSGTLPSTLANLMQLKVFDVGKNQLTGTLPDGMFEWTALTEVSLIMNKFTGQLSSRVGNWHNLRSLRLMINSFTGSLPEELYSLVHLETLYLGQNSFQGSLSKSIANLVSLTHLACGWADFSGEIPSEILGLPHLSVAELTSNHFHGQFLDNIPGALSLEIFDVSQNNLTGRINPDFCSKLKNLTYFDASDNSLSGPIPESIYQDLKLSVLGMGENCFAGTLSASICELSSLEYLIMDGLSAGKSCRRSIWPASNPFGFDGGTASYIGGSIPSCIFSLPLIKSIHLSGNGLAGALPNAAEEWGDSLRDLLLSNNFLTGTISKGLKKKGSKMHTIDLSFNKFVGTLDGLEVQPSVDLSVNQNCLSGDIPAAVRAIRRAVDVLDGNVFSCAAGNSLPRDKNAASYHCGSGLFDEYMYSLLGITILVCIIGFVQKHYLRHFFEKFTSFRDVHLAIFVNLLRDVCVIVVLGAIPLLAFIPICALIKIAYKTYSNQYAWTVSAIFTEGVTPAVVFTIVWTLSLSITGYVIAAFGFKFCEEQDQIVRSTGSEVEISIPQATEHFTIAELAEGCLMQSEDGRIIAPDGSKQGTGPKDLTAAESFARRLVIGTLNVVIVLAVNIYFVAVQSSPKFTSGQKSASTLLFGAFKPLWAKLLGILVQSSTKRGGSKSGEMVFEAFLLLFNNIVAPQVSTAVSNPSCFKSLFFAPNAVIAPYLTQFNQTDLTVIFPDVGKTNLNTTAGREAAFNTTSYGSSETTITITAQQNFVPPFVYKYVCSSLLVELFAPAFAFSVLLSAFVMPFLSLAARFLLDTGRVPSPVQPVAQALLPSKLLKTIKERPAEDGKEPFLPPAALHLATLIDLVLLLSFGYACPLLGLAYVVSILSRCFFWAYMFTQFVTSEDSHKPGDLDALKVECRDLWLTQVSIGPNSSSSQSSRVNFFYESRWMLVTFPSCFLCFFVFDMAGGRLGWKSSLWAPILMAVLPHVALAAKSVIPATIVTWMFASHTKPLRSKGAEQDCVDNTFVVSEPEIPLHLKFRASHLLVYANNPILARDLGSVEITTSNARDSDYRGFRLSHAD